MGYSHSYTFSQRPCDIPGAEEKFTEAVRLFRRGLELMNGTTTYCAWGMEVQMNLCGPEGKDAPIITDTCICFNGEYVIAHDWSHEPLYIDLYQKYPSQGVKTNRKPYDAAVCLALLCFKRAFGDDFSFDSDGNVAAGECGWSHAHVIMSMLN